MSAVATTRAPAPRTEQAAPIPWWAIVTLGLGIFTLVASEFLPASLLSPIATDLGVSEGTAGQLVTATAVAGIAAGPAIVALLPPVDRRWVMAGLTSLSVLSNLVVVIAPSLPLMLVGRALLGVALSGFWALSLAVVSSMVPQERLGRAMMIVNTGVSLATVAAVPIGAYAGAHLGWRTVFMGAAVAGAVTLVLQVTALPPIAASERSGVGPLLQTLTTPVVALGFTGLALMVTGHMAAFTYIRPMLERIDGVDAGVVAVVLAAFGISAFAGNVLAGIFADRRMRATLLAVPLLIAVATTTLSVLGGDLVLALLATAAWGVGFGAVPTTVQTWLARVAPERLESAGGLTVATFQVSIALGAVIGGVLVDAVDVRASFLAAGIAAAVAVVIYSQVRTRPRTAVQV